MLMMTSQLNVGPSTNVYQCTALGQAIKTSDIAWSSDGEGSPKFQHEISFEEQSNTLE